MFPLTLLWQVRANLVFQASFCHLLLMDLHACGLNHFTFPFFFSLKIFCCCCGPFLKVFIKSATTLLLSYVLVFWPHGILGPWPAIKPAPTVLEGKVLITGPPGSPSFPYLNCPYPSGILAVPTLSSSRNLKACFLISKSKKEKSRPTIISHSCGLLWFRFGLWRTEMIFMFSQCPVQRTFVDWVIWHNCNTPF